ncbi:MAG: hypothetical protein HYS32_02495 [Candidatus Woesearchaeota archaeon]|nr:MAG: hypothetical protein HYS32_02495 [Candidatus Woesearchaeota archaeon]
MVEVLLIRPVIAIGLIIGLYELFAIHADMNFRGSHWFGHGIHATIISIIAVFITMNTEYFLAATGLGSTSIPVITNPIIVRILVGLFMVIKVHSVSAIGGTRLASAGMAEKWTHSLVVGVLIAVAPYLWTFIGPLFPAWLQ